MRYAAPIVIALLLLAVWAVLNDRSVRETAVPGSVPPAAVPPAAGEPRLPLVAADIANRARTISASMTLEEKCAQVIMVSLGGAQSLTDDFRQRFARTPAGAVLLLEDNIAGSAEAVIELTDSLDGLARSAGGGIPAFIAVDHEGGTVFRFGNIATWLPGAARIGKSGASAQDVYDLYRNAARQLRTLGFTMNLAPILEPLDSDNQAFLEHRAFSADPEETARYGGIVIEAMRSSGVLAVGKHFPGSGKGDPHEELPLSSFGSDNPDSGILPFRRTISENRLAGIMISHVLVPALDPDLPVTISSRIQEGYLREVIGFEGIILTDDLNMQALTRQWDPHRAAVLALQAGADMIMYLPGDFPSIHAGLLRAIADGSLSPVRLDEAVVRILEQKLAADLWNRDPSDALPGSAYGADERAARRLEGFARLKTEGDELAARFLRPQS